MHLNAVIRESLATRKTIESFWDLFSLNMRWFNLSQYWITFTYTSECQLICLCCWESCRADELHTRYVHWSDEWRWCVRVCVYGELIEAYDVKINTAQQQRDCVSDRINWIRIACNFVFNADSQCASQRRTVLWQPLDLNRIDFIVFHFHCKWVFRFGFHFLFDSLFFLRQN